MARGILFTLAVLVVASGVGLTQNTKAPKGAKMPDITGKWTGEWGPFNPAQGQLLDKQKCKGLDCEVVLKDGVWHATFEGECGRPYKYTIKMEGRQAGDVVLFKGSTDLGEKDGGVYDWVGRASESGFVGFYTSAHYTGVFTLTRNK
ncbi:MAG: hypothetical protein AB7K24_07060 [Gemmataceae bacterium]